MGSLPVPNQFRSSQRDTGIRYRQCRPACSSNLNVQNVWTTLSKIFPKLCNHGDRYQRSVLDSEFSRKLSAQNVPAVCECRSPLYFRSCNVPSSGIENLGILLCCRRTPYASGVATDKEHSRVSRQLALLCSCPTSYRNSYS